VSGETTAAGEKIEGRLAKGSADVVDDDVCFCDGEADPVLQSTSSESTMVPS
jgi:hypothetical protein